MSMLSDVHNPSTRERLQQLLQEGWERLECQPLEATAPARQAEHLARRNGDNRGWAQSLFIWGVSSLYGGSLPEAIALFSRALAVYRFLDDEQGQWACLKAIGLAWGHQGDAAQAAETHAQAGAFARHQEFAARAKWLHWFQPN